jgi:hypothetical protein
MSNNASNGKSLSFLRFFSPPFPFLFLFFLSPFFQDPGPNDEIKCPDAQQKMAMDNAVANDEKIESITTAYIYNAVLKVFWSDVKWG